MSLNMSIRIILKIFLTVQLLLLIFRQVIDFAGIQWLMILVNAFAIIISIAAFFGYLELYGYFQIFLILYNVFVICIYARVITLIVPLSDGEEYVGNGHNHANNDFTTSNRAQMPATYFLSFYSNSRSFWYVIVTNHISELHSHFTPVLPMGNFITQLNAERDQHQSHSPQERHQQHQSTLMDDSVVDLCVQYIEIVIAALHIFFSLLALGLILLKYKLKRDKLFRNNDKTTPPLPPYTISPQMNHYMSFTPQHPFNTNNSKGSLYTSNSQHSLRRTSKRRRSTRSLGAKSKANSMGALNIRASSGSLRSLSKQSHRKSATSLLNDTSCSNNSNTMGSRGGGNKSTKNIYQPMMPNSSGSSSHNHHYHSHNHSQIMINHRHSAYIQGTSNNHQNNVAKFLTSDSETDGYYQTFTPHYNALQNPLYGNRSQYVHDSETAI